MKLFFVNGYDSRLEAYNRRFDRQTPGGNGVWGYLSVTDDPEEADYYVGIQGWHKDFIDVPKERRIFIQREPHIFRSTKLEKFGYKFMYSDSYHTACWWLNENYTQLKKMKHNKNLPLSTIITDDTKKPGQKLRIKLTCAINKEIDCLDIYGRGSEKIFPKSRGFVENKGDALFPYKRTICCENTATDGYFSEKFIDSILAWCKPFYWGCTNLDMFFPKEAYTKIDILDHKKSIRIIKEELEKPVNIEAIAEARELILDKYNIWPSVERAIDNIQKRRMDGTL